MVRTKLVFAIILNLFSYNLFAQSFQWAKSAGGVDNDCGFSICLDKGGNSYVGGTMSRPICYFPNDTLTINGVNDFYISKFDGSGNEIWTKQFGGPNTISLHPKYETISDIIYDSVSNAIYFAGSYYESCIFGNDTLTTSTNDIQLFHAKVDLNGNCIWAKQAGSYGDDLGSKLTSDQFGNIYIAGASVHSGYFDTIPIISGGFLAKLNPSGNCLWVKNICSYQTFEPSYAVSSIKFINNNLFMYGLTSDTLTIDTIEINNPNYAGQILSKWDINGNILWVQQFGGPTSKGWGRISLDGKSNIYLSGTFSGPYSTFDKDTLFSSGLSEMYIAKFDSTGKNVWLNQTHATQNISSTGIYADMDGNLYLTGCLEGGSASFGNYTITANSNQEIFIARYNSIGESLGVRHPGEGIGWDVVSDVNGNAFLTGETGYFSNMVIFDLTTIISRGAQDMFITKTDVFTGYGEQQKTINNQLLIYANPNDGKCNITIPDEFLNENNLVLNIYDNSGKQIQQQNITLHDGRIRINLESEAKGVYHVTLTNKIKTYNGKIVFE
jgi:hypothetical protein